MAAAALALAVLKVALIAGGGRAESNDNSHAVHLRTLAALLQARGVPAGDLTIFWADGTARGPDRAVRADAGTPGDWILADTALDAPTDAGLTLEDTRFPGLDVRPARREVLARWLGAVGRKLGPGDTLLLAVTDHGEPDPDDDRNTRIVLWGERWTQQELVADLAAVPTEVRVVLWMSQCFSGGFAEVAFARANTCGAFAANASQVAYGCFPELAGRTDVGHFVHFLDGLAAGGSLAAASDWAMLRDDTPDQPHLSSDTLLTDWLSDEAGRREVTPDALVDRGLARAGPGAPERRLAARIAEGYALGAVPDQLTMGERLIELDDLRHAAETWRDLWAPALTTGRRWLAAPFAGTVRRGASLADRRLVRRAFVERLAAAARAQPGLEDLLLALFERHAQADAAVSRLEIQSAAALRISDLYARAAAPFLLPADVRARYDAVRRCETAPLLPGATGADPAPPAPFPPARVTAAVVAELRPGYYGIHYEDEGESVAAGPLAGGTAAARRKQADARRGAGPAGTGPVFVRDITAGSPAERAGLRPGDVIVAVDAEPLARPGRFRETAFFSRPGQVRVLQVRRGGATLAVPLTAAPFPLPRRPVNLGERVGALELRPLPQDTALPVIGQGRPTVLLFWETWCKPCKTSLPALVRWAADHGTQVIAVTDESADTVARFVRKAGGFPFPIALDAGGAARALFSVGATPTFVLVNARGHFADVGTGFDGHIPLRDPPRP